jgi:hypothetical protein
MRLKIGGDKYASYYPQERPLPGASIKIWDDKGVYLGFGSAFDTRKCGVVLIVKGRTIDSNEIAHWCYE